jgi:hypothetical protein
VSQSKLEEMSRRFKSGAISRILVYVLILLLGVSLVALGYFLDTKNEVLLKLHLDSAATGLGFVLIGLGFGGIVTAIGDDRFVGGVIDLLRQSVEEMIEAAKWTVIDHVASSALDLEVPGQYRSILHLYHKTAANIRGQNKSFWRHSTADFSKDSSKKRLHATEAVTDPRSPDQNVVYQLELLIQQNMIIIFDTNISDPGEMCAIRIFEMPVLSDSACGFMIHMDWESNRRVDKAIISTTDLLAGGKIDEGLLEATWNSKIANRYAIDIQQPRKRNHGD